MEEILSKIIVTKLHLQVIMYHHDFWQEILYGKPIKDQKQEQLMKSASSLLRKSISLEK